MSEPTERQMRAAVREYERRARSAESCPLILEGLGSVIYACMMLPIHMYTLLRDR